MQQALRQHRIIINLALFIIISLGLLILLPSRVEASDPVKAEMYMGDYEIRKSKVGSSFVYEEVKYIETGSAKVIKKRTSTTNTWVSSYYHTNHQGSTSVVSDNQGRVDTEYSKGRLRYFPYGGQITRHNINTQVVADTYTGQKKDTESNLMFYNARLYNQKTGLFMQADSVDDGLNRYAYVSGNPINATDPSGRILVPDDPGSKKSQTTSRERTHQRVQPISMDPKDRRVVAPHVIYAFENPASGNKSIIQPLYLSPYSEKWSNITNTIDKNFRNNLSKSYDSSREVDNAIENMSDSPQVLGAMALAVQQSVVYNPDILAGFTHDWKATTELNEYKIGSFSMAAFENYKEQANYYFEKGWSEYDANPDMLSRFENNQSVCFDFSIIMNLYMKGKGYKNVDLAINSSMGHAYLTYKDMVIDPTWGQVFDAQNHKSEHGYTSNDVYVNSGMVLVSP